MRRYWFSLTFGEIIFGDRLQRFNSFAAKSIQHFDFRAKRYIFNECENEDKTSSKHSFILYRSKNMPQVNEILLGRLYIWCGTGVWIDAKVFNHIAWKLLLIVCRAREANKVIICLLFSYQETEKTYWLSLSERSAIKRKKNVINAFFISFFPSRGLLKEN